MQDDRWLTRIAGEVKDWDSANRLDHSEIKKMDRFSQLGTWAAVEAMEDSGLDWEQGDPYRRGDEGWITQIEVAVELHGPREKIIAE